MPTTHQSPEGNRHENSSDALRLLVAPPPVGNEERRETHQPAFDGPELTLRNHKRVAVINGAFDPIHEGHIELANKCIHNLSLDTLVLLVDFEKLSEGRNCSASFDKRVEMCLLATAHLPNIKTSTALRGESSTTGVIKFLASLREHYPGIEALHLCFGSDALQQDSLVQDLDLLKEICLPTVLLRSKDGRLLPIPDSLRSQIEVVQDSQWTYSTSSREVRRELAHFGASRNLHPAVLKYCKERDLYAHQ